MKRVLILGGGFGGVATAHELRNNLSPEDEIVVIDRRAHFMVGFRKTWAMLGTGTLEEGQGSLHALNEKGIRFVQGNITAIDPAARSIEVDGKTMSGDALVVALGAQLDPEAIPGLKENALNVYDDQSIPAVASQLESFSGGKIIVGIFGAPYKCPPAPYEMALMIHEYFQARNVPVELEAFTPKPMSLPILGSIGCDIIESRLTEFGIGFLPNRKATAVEDNQVVFQDGEKRSFDLLLGVAPHKCPDVILDSGLTNGRPWIAPDPRTLETSFSGVYAIGDCVSIPLADGKQLPKAGIFAELQGKVVAGRIAARTQGKEPSAFYDGTGFCFLEFGGGKVAYVRGNFYARPTPEVVLTEMSPKFLEEKQAFEKNRLAAWFGV